MGPTKKVKKNALLFLHWFTGPTGKVKKKSFSLLAWIHGAHWKSKKKALLFLYGTRSARFQKKKKKNVKTQTLAFINCIQTGTYCHSLDEDTFRSPSIISSPYTVGQ